MGISEKSLSFWRMGTKNGSVLKLLIQSVFRLLLVREVDPGLVNSGQKQRNHHI